MYNIESVRLVLNGEESYILSRPDEKGFVLSWEDMGVTETLIDGTKVKVYLNADQKFRPKVALKYKYYDDAAIESLEELLSAVSTSGKVELSFGGLAYLEVNISKWPELKPNSLLFADVDLEFTAKKALPSMTWPEAE